ncbi:MAG TPA: DegT/DnrJ/EryC1/StrS family aminotransferase [Opitutaceae bacterium]|nr:DegT/DnrJ/EryC1/StrS family aminotransferase [Opitutaceae bacterium]
MKVPFLDLKAQNDPIRAELLSSIEEVIDRTAFAGGPYVAKFEKEFAAFCHTGHAVGLGNGTDALWFALLALGVGPGDEVITVSHTFMATAEAISFCGATPVFVDVEDKTFTMNPALIERAITPRTKAIIPVHLYGQMADMDPIMEIANRHGIPVIEDACQAHGAEYKGRQAGSIGIAGCFSFYPGKNLGAFGEAGAVVTNDASLAKKMQVLRDHGQETKYHHSVIGWNGRMDGIQGAVLSIKLKHLAKGNELRRRNAALYTQLIGDNPLISRPATADYATHVFHLYVVRVGERDRVLQALADKGVSCGIHYPKPVHLQKAYAHLSLGPGSFPVTEKCAGEILSLPMFPELTETRIRTVVEELSPLVSAPIGRETVGA